VGPSVMIVGPGRMGLALASALEQAGAVGRLTICGRTPEAPAHPLFTQGRARYVFGLVPLEVDTAALIIAVPDAAVPEIALNMAAHGPALEGCAALHLSGILVLQPLHAQGYAVGSLHPMQRVSHPGLGGRSDSGVVRSRDGIIGCVGDRSELDVSLRVSRDQGSRGKEAVGSRGYRHGEPLSSHFTRSFRSVHGTIRGVE
jgi:hypothetical protein